MGIARLRCLRRVQRRNGGKLTVGGNVARGVPTSITRIYFRAIDC
jgi:hypothetical protein